ncbi:hypothetical protein EDEG_01974 [Edhazardia aedis USNM 41457]|uniref:Transcription initiation factor TFIID subunit 4 n=1 Tax=Edhazardia aedis (strain USNM 41457) TaxID=1003232 RepID=J9D7H7_EDHAE|nr:hypothetical protein EDEG_01974 [Edhazardia aedis USNM 41457]|eukprot:EJW03736.1 hypothetical protein EDEG_01974 [Edhazardia aedis USNM 41457]
MYVINEEYLNSLGPEEREIIENLYYSLNQGEINTHQFFSSIKEHLGDDVLMNLFPVAPQERPQAEIKPEHLSDILQYSGIDLKYEQEAIIDTEDDQGYVEEGEDPNLQTSSLIDEVLFCDYVNKIVLSRQMNISQDTYHTLFLILRRKIFDMIDKIIQASKMRIDVERSEFEKKIVNDVKRQLWILEQNERRELEGLQLSQFDEQKKKLKKSCKSVRILSLKKE